MELHIAYYEGKTVIIMLRNRTAEYRFATKIKTMLKKFKQGKFDDLES